MKGLVWQVMLSDIIAYGFFGEAYGYGPSLGQVCSLRPQLVCRGGEQQGAGQHEPDEHVRVDVDGDCAGLKFR